MKSKIASVFGLVTVIYEGRSVWLVGLPALILFLPIQVDPVIAMPSATALGLAAIIDWLTHRVPKLQRIESARQRSTERRSRRSGAAVNPVERKHAIAGTMHDTLSEYKTLKLDL